MLKDAWPLPVARGQTEQRHADADTREGPQRPRVGVPQDPVLVGPAWANPQKHDAEEQHRDPLQVQEPERQHGQLPAARAP